MKNNIKDFLKREWVQKKVTFILRIFFSIFYKRKYLRGKHFDESYVGWIWSLNNLGSRLFGNNRKIPWPMNKNSVVSDYKNLIFDQSSINCLQQHGCYFQNFKGKIVIKSNVWIAPNVGIITANHDPSNLSNHLEGKDVTIGNNCWIGMNAVILPGVELKDSTVVAAGAVVNKSFNEGNIIVGGVPATIIKKLK